MRIRAVDSAFSGPPHGHAYGSITRALYPLRARLCPRASALKNFILGVNRRCECARGRGAVDRTRYGTTRVSTRSHYVHHMQQIVKAAVEHDAMAIRKQIISLKQRVCANAAHAAPASDGSDSE